MRKYYLALTIQFLCISAFSQTSINNGVTSYSCPLYPLNNLGKRSAFAIDNSGNKWIGFTLGTSSSAVLVRYDGTSWISFAHDFPTNKVHALAVDTGKTLWVGTNYGLFRFYDTTLVNSYPGGPILSLACGGGNLYEGTTAGLIVRNNAGTVSYTHASNALASDTILSIAYESPTAIWLGNPKGLDKFDGSGAFTFYNVQPTQRDSVMCIYIDGANNKWLGTNHHGVIRYDNSSFSTMQQLYGTPRGVSWPTKAYSIDKGPNGGIFFAGHHRVSNITPAVCDLPCSIELVNGQIKAYAWVATSYMQPGGIYYYSIFRYDAASGKAFFANVDGNMNTFLYSFDASLYSWPMVTQNNSDYLDINNVQGLITSNSDMGTDHQGTKYFVPKGSNSSPLRAGSLWMGGYHNGGLRLGAMTYRQNGADFWPGPLDPITDSTDQATSDAFDKVWKVNRYDIANFIYNWNAGTVQSGSFVPSAGILTWPGDNAHPLAPFVDVNGDGFYNPINDGDYPAIKGDQMIWWTFNDKLHKHSETGAASMGVQVNASAYAFVCPNIADSNKVLNYTTFYNYKVINFSPDKIDSFYLSPWIDADLGNYLDDYIQCNVSNNYGFIYNGDNYDEDGYTTGYHTNLPVFSCDILSGPLADAGDGKDNNNDGVIDEMNERCMMNTFTYYTNTGDQYTGNPRSNTPSDYYNFMNARWRNGTTITYGGNGVNPGSTETCHHVFPGISDPYGVSIGGSATFPQSPSGNYGACGWTEPQAGVLKSDMRFIIGVGPFTMQPGGSYELDYALVFSQDSNYVDTGCVNTLALADNIRVKRWFDNNSFPSCLSLAGVGVKENGLADINVAVYPNPASDILFVEMKETHAKATIEIVDLLGNVVKGATYMAPSKYMSIPVSEMANGLYVIRIKTSTGEISRKFVKE